MTSSSPSAASGSQDGHILTYPGVLPQGRAKKLIHVNGVMSTPDKQHRDLEALAWMTVEAPLDIIGVHNSTQGFQNDMLECLLGKAELFGTWESRRTEAVQKRLRAYAALVEQLLEMQPLPLDCDILQQIQSQSSALSLPQAIANQLGFDFSLLKRLPLLNSMNLEDLSLYLYGNFPAGAPRAILRLAYEIIQAIRQGTEVMVMAHSQGTIISALAFHIVEQFFGGYAKWVSALHFIGYGPVIVFEDLPVPMRSRAILLQHREDLVAESLSNFRNTDLLNNVQTQLQKLLENADKLAQIIRRDSHHSASHYLGLTPEASSQQSAQLLQQWLTQPWSNAMFRSLCFSRIVLETKN
ncbi:hypothetical protein [Lyngbya confervoides]|uniref:Uncharacterized protein n=1 Tax=Lyngbya confervoides BDU141951 TaxID=1574623 RepID=A0ABD4SY40_9CYAN|nr:hypothetical protein [Lyngbya confervoides]MCM1981274.1 hypothetical protein [Lyngbya confervoides BDU141951]